MLVENDRNEMKHSIKAYNDNEWENYCENFKSKMQMNSIYKKDIDKNKEKVT
jgi:hypothetical protein